MQLAREHNDRAWLAYHIAALTRVNPKKMPKLRDLQVRVDSPVSAEMSVEQQWARMKTIAAGRKLN